MRHLAGLRASGRKSLHQNVYEALKSALMSGEFAPGQQLTVREIAELAGTSAMPVRQAMGRLVSDGALQDLPNGSIRVCQMTREQRDEAREIRASLEGLALRRAATHATAQEIDETERINETMFGALSAGDFRLFVESNRAFHFSIYRAARSDKLFAMIEGLWMQNGPLLAQHTEYFIASRGRARQSKEIHMQMIRALRARNPDAAERAIHADIASMAPLGFQNEESKSPPRGSRASALVKERKEKSSGPRPRTKSSRG